MEGQIIDQQLRFGEGTSAGLVRHLRVAVENEMQATSSDVVARLLRGHCLSTTGSRSVWSFAVEPGDVDEIPVDNPATLTSEDGRTADSRVLAVGDESVVLSLPIEFDSDGAWTMASDARFINDQLLKRLDELLESDDCDEELLGELIYPDEVIVEESDESDLGSPTDAHDDQALAALRAVQPGVRFTWGPPGTGKTRVLGMAVAQAADEGLRVLVLAHANVAVDVALERLADELGTDHPLIASGRVVRVGTPRSETLAARTELLPDRIAGRQNPDLADRITALRTDMRRLSGLARSNANDSALVDQIHTTRSELRAAQVEQRELAREVVDGAAVVATTLSRAVIDDQIWSTSFDVVVIDEASMAPLPIVLALILRGARTVSFFGDFRQLPPVAVSTDDTARQYFGKDVFDYGQVIAMYEPGAVDPRLHTLKTQFRMGEQICSVVNDLAYDGMLRTAPVARDAAIRGAEAGIGQGEELVVVDTANLGTSCTFDVSADSWSRVNLLHAALVASLAESLHADGFATVGVISPYRAQIQLLSPLVRSIDGVTAATIHKFQGSECDAIVLDLTDAAPMPGPSTLTGNDAELARRLFNVAVSRARHKLVHVADVDFVEHGMSLAAMPQRLLKAMFAAGADRADASWVAERLIAGDRSAADLCSTGAPLPPRPIWFADWPSALQTLLAGGGEAGPIEANVAGNDTLATWFATNEAAVRGYSPVLIRAPHQVARLLESTGYDLRLQTRGDTPWVIVNGSAVAIGSRSDVGPVAVVGDPLFAAAVRRVAAPEEG